MRKKDSFHDEGYDDRQLIELSLMTPKPPGTAASGDRLACNLCKLGS